MDKKALIFLIIATLCSRTASAEEKFITRPGMIFIGGNVSILYFQDFSENSASLFSASLKPMFGQFITRDIMLFTHFGFSIQNYAVSSGVGLLYPYWNGSVSIGAQGRYFFSTENTLNFFLGLEVTFGMNISSNYENLGEHILTGVVAGFFIPFNEKVGLDLSFSPLVYLPLNSYQPTMMLVVTSVGIISTL